MTGDGRGCSFIELETRSQTCWGDSYCRWLEGAKQSAELRASPPQSPTNTDFSVPAFLHPPPTTPQALSMAGVQPPALQAAWPRPQRSDVRSTHPGAQPCSAPALPSLLRDQCPPSWGGAQPMDCSMDRSPSGGPTLHGGSGFPIQGGRWSPPLPGCCSAGETELAAFSAQCQGNTYPGSNGGHRFVSITH